MQIAPELIPVSCNSSVCPATERCCHIPTEVNPDTEGNVTLLFVGQGGGSDERKKGRPFIGRAGARLRNQVLYLRKMLRTHVGVAFSNTIRDNPEGNRIPSAQELRECLQFLYSDIRELKKRGLKVVIPLGNAAKDALIPGIGPIGQSHGQLYNIENSAFGRMLCCPTYHPSYVMRKVPKFDSDNLSEIDDVVISDIKRAYERGKSIIYNREVNPSVEIDDELLKL